jgi:hypothetical protein
MRLVLASESVKAERFRYQPWSLSTSATFDYTTEDVPEGSGATFSPSFFNMGISYAHLFANKVSVGITFKFVNEGISNARASAIALDAGVQYVTGDKGQLQVWHLAPQRRHQDAFPG